MSSLVFEISDDLEATQIMIEKAIAINGSIIEKYFLQSKDCIEENYFMEFDYEQVSTLMHILDDYLFGANEKSNILKEKINKLRTSGTDSDNLEKIDTQDYKERIAQLINKIDSTKYLRFILRICENLAE